MEGDLWDFKCKCAVFYWFLANWESVILTEAAFLSSLQYLCIILKTSNGRVGFEKVESRIELKF